MPEDGNPVNSLQFKGLWIRISVLVKGRKTHSLPPDRQNLPVHLKLTERVGVIFANNQEYLR